MMPIIGATAGEEPLLGTAGMWVIGFYLLALIGIGLVGRMARQENSMSDFFLGGRNLGFIVLLLTLYATQYSGNTLIGFAAKAYRSGFTFLVALPFMMGIIGMYLIFAPRLQRLSRKYNFITLGDYVQHRFNHRGLTTLIAVSGIIALCNFLVTNLKAMGEMAFLVTGGLLSEGQGIVLLAIVILIYETLGGLRSVAWTDVLQGVLLVVGCTIIFVATLVNLGGISGAAEQLHEVRPDFWEAPGFKQCLGWVSTAMIVSIGLALYPHAIQRIYAARSPRTLKRSLQVMVFFPLITTLLMVTIGVLGNIAYPGLSNDSSEGITLLVLKDFAMTHPAAGWVTIVFVAAVFAAIMSTADSALLAIASSATQDLLRPLTNIDDQHRLTLLGKVISTSVMAIAVIFASNLPASIWQLIQIKTELLAQTAPALLCGLYFRQLNARAVLTGFLVGTAFTLFFLVGNYFAPDSIAHKPFGVHAGLWGVILNFGLIWWIGRRTTD
ncbi:MAG: sodium:solute symporter family protein [Verrucomicrobiota bacterium]